VKRNSKGTNGNLNRGRTRSIGVDMKLVVGIAKPYETVMVDVLGNGEISDMDRDEKDCREFTDKEVGEMLIYVEKLIQNLPNDFVNMRVGEELTDNEVGKVIREFSKKFIVLHINEEF
jgi:hypothetical protein